MKKLLLAALLLTGCAESGPHAPPAPPPSKVVADKIQATEQRLSFDIFDSKNSVRSRATTVYYLVSDDGMVAEVSMKEWVSARKGEEYQTRHWRKP